MDEILVNWLSIQKETEGFKRFWKKIEDQFERKRDSALHQGNTEFAKGEAAALKWVLKKPNDIMLETQTDKEKKNG